MPDRRVPRPTDKPTTPGGEGTEYPLNDGGVPDYKIEQEEEKQAIDRMLKKRKKQLKRGDGLPKRLETKSHGGGFGIKPMADVLSQAQRSVTEMSGADKFVTLSYQDVLSYIYGDNELEQVIAFVQNDEEYTFNPPTRDEFGQMLKFAISRKSGKIAAEDAPSIKARANARIKQSPSSGKDFADPINKAFPVDSDTRAKAAHAYIHKYWNAPSKRGITATYGKNDFIAVHKKIVDAMKKHDIEHNYLDSLDDASGFSKPENKNISSAKIVSCEKCKTTPCSCSTIEDIKATQGNKGVGLFGLKVGQQVISFARGGTRIPGEIIKIDGAVANVQWQTGLLTTELLVSLVPD